MLLTGLAGLCGLVSLACAIMVLIHAFTKGGVLQGFLSLCIPFYIFYYAFAKFEHEKKNMILGIWIGAIVLQFGLIFAAGGMAAMQAGQQ